MDLVIWVLREKLSDGSEVFNVDLNGEQYPAITESDAAAMAEKIAAAVNAHSNSEAGVMYQ